MPLPLKSPDVHLVISAVPSYGHIRPLRSLASSLASLGYPITFLTGSVFENSVKSIDGVEFVPLTGKADFDMGRVDEYFPDRKLVPKGVEIAFYDLEHLFYASLPDQYSALQAILKRPELHQKKIVILADTGFMGTLPMMLDAQGSQRVPLITIGSLPLVMLSKDTAPFGLGLPSQGEEANMAMNANAIEMFSGIQTIVERILEPYNCAKPTPTRCVLNDMVLVPDIYAQCSVAELEPPRRDLPPNIRYIGNVPGGNDRKPLPSWFQEFVVDDSTDRPLILITQGTIAGSSPDELIMPTIAACKDLDVRIVVCGVHVHRPSDEDLPKNARWAKWIAFEDLFPYTSLVVSNGGYGGINQAFAAGIPMVVSGTTEDKTETTLRAEMTGAAINLRKQRPEAEEIRDALSKILLDPSYKNKALELKKAYAEYKPVEEVVSFVEELAGKFYP